MFNWFSNEKTAVEVAYEEQMAIFQKEIDYCAEILEVNPREEPTIGLCFEGKKGFYDLTDLIVGWNRKMVEALEKLNNARN